MVRTLGLGPGWGLYRWDGGVTWEGGYPKVALLEVHRRCAAGLLLRAVLPFPMLTGVQPPNWLPFLVLSSATVIFLNVIQFL